MALKYTEAPTVAKGAAITSSQWNGLCDALNDRLSKGVADPTWRLHWFWHSLFRNLRNPDASGFTYAPEDEWWKIYAHVDTSHTFPVVAAGQPEGASLSNPINGFVFGNPSQDIKSEAARLSYDSADGQGVLLHDTGGNPLNDSRKWAVGIEQRGAVLETNLDDLSYANALVAARAHFSMGFHHWVHRSYGGFMAGPEYQGQCSNYSELPDYTLKFTNTSTSTTTTYSTCPGSGVYSYYRGQKDYILLNWDGTVTRLPVSDYTEGPYTSDAYLKHPNGEQLNRALNYFIQPFRGTAAEQAASGYKVQDKAFDFDTFLQQQYFLAPARGVANGSGGVDAVYNIFNWGSNTSANALGTLNATSSTSFATASGFCLAGVLVQRQGGTGEKRFEVLVDGAVVTTVTLPNGDDSKSEWFASPHNGTVSVRCLDSMGASDVLEVECAELMEYLPSNEDAYLVLRLGSASNLAYDAEGKDASTPKDISDAYFRHGMVHNPNRADVADDNTALNANPVYRAVAREVSSRLKMVDRHGLLGYEVNGAGKSVFYFKREAFGLSVADMFDGLGPSNSIITSGNLIAGRTYKVVGGTSITYNGGTVNAGSTFTAVSGVDTYTKAGSEEVYENEGIRATAEPAGYDNRWLMHMESMSYKPSESSAYKPDSYTDIIGYKHDRCAMWSQAWTSPSPAYAKEILKHVTPLPSGILQRSENPPGYRYLLGTHTPDEGYNASGNLIAQANGDGSPNNDVCDPLEEDGSEGNCTGMRGHWKSCKIYRPDYQIESAQRVEPAGPNQLPQIKITLTTRLDHNEDAPGTIANTSASRASYISSDSTGATYGGYRTDENAVVEYLRYVVDNGANCGQRIGDTAPDAPFDTAINGACMPRFFFTQLLPKVYEDGNSSYDSTDTLMKTEHMSWAETILRSICEGYVDSASTAEQLETIDPVTSLATCEDKRLYDYTFENLMLQANSKQHFRSLTSDLRTDEVKGHGPLPGQPAYADHFNQISRAVNLLTKARLYLPLSFKYRTINYSVSQQVINGSIRSNEATPNCSGGAVWANNITSTPTWTGKTYGSWQTSSYPGLVTTKRCRIDQDSAGNCVLECDRQDGEFTVGLDRFATDAMHPDLATLVQDTSKLGFGVANGYSTTPTIKTAVANSYNGWIGNSTDPDDYYHDGSYHDWVETPNPSANSSGIVYYNTCEVSNGGEVEAPDVPVSDYVDTGGTGSGGNGTFAEGRRAIYASSAQAFVTVPLKT